MHKKVVWYVCTNREALSYSYEHMGIGAESTDNIADFACLRVSVATLSMIGLLLNSSASFSKI